MYSTGQRSHSQFIHSFQVHNPAFTGEITSRHPGLELTFSLNPKRSQASHLTIRGQNFALSNPSSILIYNPQEDHQEHFYQKDQNIEAVVFSPSVLKQTMGNHFDDQNYVFDQVQVTDPVFAGKIKALYQVLRNSSLDEWTVNGLSEGLITFIFSAMNPEFGNAATECAAKTAKSLANYLATNFQDQDCWLGDAESKFDITKFHLIRAFRNRYGKTPHRFLTELRINYASEQLRARNGKIIDIANKSGFEDLSTFNKCFRRHFGMSPRQFVANP